MLLIAMDAPEHAVECLKSYGLHHVWLVHPPGESPHILKTWPLGPMTLIKLALGIAQPQRQMRGVHLLQQGGILTPRCLGSWRIRRRGRHLLVELELDFAPGISALDMISNAALQSAPDSAVLIRCARRVGRIVTDLANAGAFHRDLKPSNVVIDTADPQVPMVWIIDTVGVRPVRRRLVEIERMLERLAIQPSRLPASLTWAIRIAALRAALRPLSARDRRIVFERLRRRAGRFRRP